MKRNRDMCAYPMPGHNECNEFNVEVPSSGLTKREHFAAMAMQGFLAAGWNDHTMPERAVNAADELLAELEK